MNLILRTSFLLSFVVLTAAAQGLSTGGSSLLLPLTAESGAYADANVAAAASLAGVTQNPAALRGLVSNEIRFTHLQWFEEVQGQSLLAGVPTSIASFSFAVTNVSVPGIEVREIPGPPIGTFTARAVSIRGGAAAEVSRGLSAGMTLKYLYEKIYVDEATGFGADAGLLYQPEEMPWTFGASVTNLGSLGAFRSQSSTLPSAVHVGASRSLDALGWSWTIYGAVSRETRIAVNHVHAAAEALYDGTFAVRAGYVSGYETRTWSAGLGLAYRFLRVDYSLIPFSLGLSSAHCLSISVQF
jgi:hypothetical protein